MYAIKKAGKIVQDSQHCAKTGEHVQPGFLTRHIAGTDLFYRLSASAANALGPEGRLAFDEQVKQGHSAVHKPTRLTKTKSKSGTVHADDTRTG
jgi:hypothetical protein